MLDPLFCARLVRDARITALEHSRHAGEHPNQHRGCLWCYDGRLSHWFEDIRNFYHLADEDISQVSSLYDRAYPLDYEGLEPSDGRFPK
jgi:hypothetical protein